MARRKLRNVHDVEQTGRQVGSWIFRSLILSNNQSSGTLWVLGSCLIVELRPLMIILMTTSLSSKMYSKAPKWRSFSFVVA